MRLLIHSQTSTVMCWTSEFIASDAFYASIYNSIQNLYIDALNNMHRCLLNDQIQQSYIQCIIEPMLGSVNILHWFIDNRYNRRMIWNNNSAVCRQIAALIPRPIKNVYHWEGKWICYMPVVSTTKGMQNIITMLRLFHENTDAHTLVITKCAFWCLSTWL